MHGNEHLFPLFDNIKGVFGPRKIRWKEKNLKSNFLFIVWFEKSQKAKKVKRKKERKICCIMNKNFSFQI